MKNNFFFYNNLITALPFFFKSIPENWVNRVSAIVLLFYARLNYFILKSISSGIAIYSGLPQITINKQLMDIILYIIASLKLIAWPLIKNNHFSQSAFLRVYRSLFGINYYGRISIIIFCAILSLNIESIGSEIAIYSGLPQITIIKQLMDENLLFSRKSTLRSLNKKIHTSSINYSGNNTASSTISKEELSSILNPTQDLDTLSLVKFNPTNEELKLPQEGASEFAESFPWFVDDNGQLIDYNKSIKLFDGIKLISVYLEKRLGVDPTWLSDSKLSELLKPFTENKDKDISVIELYNHINEQYINNNDFLKSKSISDKIKSDFNSESNVNENPVDTIEILSKPLGKWGDITINEAIVRMKEAKLDWVINNVDLSLKILPASTALIGYGFVLKNYVKYVHNRPYPDLSPRNLLHHQRIRNRQLMLFAVLGAPIVIGALRYTSVYFKNMISINVLPSDHYTSPSQRGERLLPDSNNSNNLSNSYLWLLLSKLNNKLPNWLKSVFKLLLIGIFIIKLLGYKTILTILDNRFYFKLAGIIICLLIIIYDLLNIYLLYKFSKKDMKISEFLPKFIQKKLKMFEDISSVNEDIKIFKDMYYRNIFVYFLIILVLIILL